MTTMTKPLTDQTPREIDTALAPIWQAMQKEKVTIAGYRRAVEREAFRPHPSQSLIAQYEALIATAIDRLKALDAQATPLEVEYDTRRWNRYFLVTNSNGHVHRGMNCNTCFPTTQYGWLPELSGCDEGEMIAEFGEKACTICFPAAPTYPSFHAPGRRDAAAKAERDAEKLLKATAKAAKAITAPDGTPLKVHGNVIQTKIAAQRELSAAVQSYGWYGPTHPNGFLGEIAVLSEALTAAGIDPKPIIDRAAKKIAKEGGKHILPAR